jgi:hypothetical protein
MDMGGGGLQYHTAVEVFMVLALNESIVANAPLLTFETKMNHFVSVHFFRPHLSVELLS